VRWVEAVIERTAIDAAAIIRWIAIREAVWQDKVDDFVFQRALLQRQAIAFSGLATGGKRQQSRKNQNRELAHVEASPAHQMALFAHFRKLLFSCIGCAKNTEYPLFADICLKSSNPFSQIVSGIFRKTCKILQTSQTGVRTRLVHSVWEIAAKGGR
jgi:hypothetical protein